MEGNVRPTTGGYPCQSATGRKTLTQSSCTLQAHTGPMEAQVENNNILIGGGRFGIEYVGKKHAEQLTHTTQEHYQVSMDWDGKHYCGISIKCNYQI